MPIVSIRTMDGDPQELLPRKKAVIDPVADELAPTYGALLSITGTTSRGVVEVSIWEDAESAEEFSRDPAVLAAQAHSGLPTITPLQQLENVIVKDYLTP